jgi:hypothetical protein
MEPNSVDDIFAANLRTREKLRELLSGVTETEAAVSVDGKQWTVSQIVEHIAAVEEGSSKICAKLLSKAQADDDRSDGEVTISDSFKEKGREIAVTKVEAPDIVRPTGKSLAESFAKMEENSKWWEKLLPLFKAYDGTKRKFPHPFFGQISAQEWLLLSGQHEKRHAEQIKKLLNK